MLRGASVDDYNCQAAQGWLLEKGDVEHEAWQEKALLGGQPGLQICVQSEFFCYYILVAFVFHLKFRLKKIVRSWTYSGVCVVYT